MTARANQEICCEICGDAFVFTSGEQSFYAEKGFDAPKRCAGCRDSRRRSRSETDTDAPREAGHQVVCSACGALTRLPFLPADERPVYCKPCFRNR